MRQAFIKQLVELARQDPRIMLLTGDLGYMALEPFADEFPDRFINCGVAEQNMMGVATGLAESGFLPFVYSIVTFATLRGFEFIRNGPVIHGLPVRVVGVGGGVEYGHNGVSHYGLEDVGAMRLLAGMNVFAPADAGQTTTVLAKTWDTKGPAYYRLGKDEKAVVPGLDGRFEVGRAQVVWDGDDVLMLSMGAVGADVSQAAELLLKKGVIAAHWVAASIEPAPVVDIKAALAKFRVVITVEAHRTTGGLGSIVSEIAAEETGRKAKVVRLGIDHYLGGRSGSQAFLHSQHGISGEAIAARVLCELNGP